MQIDLLKKQRQQALLVLPQLFQDLQAVRLLPESQKMDEEKSIQALFPHICRQPVLKGRRGEKRAFQPLQVGVVFSGGQAAGGHNVIIGIYDCLKQLHPDAKVFGFLDGPGGIVTGKSIPLTSEKLTAYRNLGGFDMIGSGRAKIETEEHLSFALACVQKMSLDGLVIIGGDDSNTNAAVLAEYFKKHQCRTKVIGVPKTIDGDLQNAHVAISFGFDTACRVYSESIGNIACDAVSAKKYTHFIRLMGRSASHIALECALNTQPNMTLIAEELAAQKKTLSQIVHDIADLVCKRAELGKNFGVILIPEGVIEFIPEMNGLIQELNTLLANDSLMSIDAVVGQLTPSSRVTFSSLPEKIQQQLLLHRDPHGNVQVSWIETERLLSELVEKEIAQRVGQGVTQAKFLPVNHFLGYEGRAGYPTSFDCHYCYALGFTAALLVSEGFTGYMACVSDLNASPEKWEIGGVPLTPLMQMQLRKGKEKPVIQKTLVDLNAKLFSSFQERRQHWALQDAYLYPGPIQFFGPSSVTYRVPLTLAWV